MTNIYHRSNPLRAYEKSTQSTLRYLTNNWFGILPFLSMVLPPSFNATELYDPVTFLGTPFLIPDTPEKAMRMNIGTIRSYGLTGGITVAGDIFSPIVDKVRETYKISELKLSLPYSIFKEGNHTVSILRKSEYIYWLLVTDRREFGHRIDSFLGTSFRVFEKLVSYWQGIKAPISPIDVSYFSSQLSQLDQLYTFDFRYPAARKAFQKALSGDFSDSYHHHKKQKTKRAKGSHV